MNGSLSRNIEVGGYESKERPAAGSLGIKQRARDRGSLSGRETDVEEAEAEEEDEEATAAK